MTDNKITYSQTGVNYKSIDPLKVLAQMRAKETAGNLSRFNAVEKVESRGESAYVWEEQDAFRAFVMEGLGTKNLIADVVRSYTKKTHYDAIAQDTVAAIINDLIVVGADPQIITAYFAVGKADWFLDEERTKDLIEGWAKACNMAGIVWGGGETPSLKGIINPDTIDLGGSATGVIKPKEHLVLGDKLQAGDAIILIESSGLHTNGATLARAIADTLSDGYATKLSDGKTYGEALLTPSHIYAKLVRDCFTEGIIPHYMVHITGHGWRKLMRAKKQFSYVLNLVPPPSPLFTFIQERSKNDDAEMYGSFNMGAGFAFFVEAKDVEKVLAVSEKNNLKAWNAGIVEEGKKQVIIKPKNLVFAEDSLQVRS